MCAMTLLMGSKTVGQTRLTMSRMMRSHHANRYGFVHGGTILRLADSAAGLTGIRHAGTRVVTACVDKAIFHAPVQVGELLHVHASINAVGRTSMDIGVRVEAEDVFTGSTTHVATAYFCFVAVDDHGRALPVPSLDLETDDDRRRHDQALQRRKLRTLPKAKPPS